jgi:hypothetical protein
MTGYDEIFKRKIALDMDGTAYSGRFMALMASRSAVLKSRVFREAMDETLIREFFDCMKERSD